MCFRKLFIYGFKNNLSYFFKKKQQYAIRIMFIKNIFIFNVFNIFSLQLSVFILLKISF